MVALPCPFTAWLPALFPKFKLHTSDRIHPLFGRKNVHGREEFIRECKETVTALKSIPMHQHRKGTSMKAGDSLIQKSSLPYSANWMTPGSSIPPVAGLTDGREISK